MYDMNLLYQEIDAVIANFMTNKNTRLHPEWITQSVIESHDDITGDDEAFYIFSSRLAIRDQVRRRLNKFKIKPTATPDDQLILEGFERLQQYYLVDEGGEQIAVHVHRLERLQIEEKIQELRMMGDGCYQHADELARYLDSRNEEKQSDASEA